MAGIISFEEGVADICEVKYEEKMKFHWMLRDVRECRKRVQ